MDNLLIKVTNIVFPSLNLSEKNALKNNLVEIVEIKEHPWFVAVQFHPEYKSTVENPHPLFVNFIKAAEKWKVESTSTAQEA